MKTLAVLLLVVVTMIVARADGDGLSASDAFTIFLHDLTSRYHRLSEQDKLFLAELVMAAELNEVPEFLARVGSSPMGSLHQHLSSSDRYKLDSYLRTHHA